MSCMPASNDCLPIEYPIQLSSQRAPEIKYIRGGCYCPIPFNEKGVFFSCTYMMFQYYTVIICVYSGKMSAKNVIFFNGSPRWAVCIIV